MADLMVGRGQLDYVETLRPGREPVLHLRLFDARRAEAARQTSATSPGRSSPSPGRPPGFDGFYRVKKAAASGWAETGSWEWDVSLEPIRTTGCIDRSVMRSALTGRARWVGRRHAGAVGYRPRRTKRWP